MDVWFGEQVDGCMSEIEMWQTCVLFREDSDDVELKVVFDVDRTRGDKSYEDQRSDSKEHHPSMSDPLRLILDVPLVVEPHFVDGIVALIDQDLDGKVGEQLEVGSDWKFEKFSVWRRDQEWKKVKTFDLFLWPCFGTRWEKKNLLLSAMVN